MIDPYAQEVLNTLDNFDDYMSQLEVIADMGSGAGHHARWWANKEPIKGNKQKKYIVLAVDDTVSIDNKNRQNNIRHVSNPLQLLPVAGVVMRSRPRDLAALAATPTRTPRTSPREHDASSNSVASLQ